MYRFIAIFILIICQPVLAKEIEKTIGQGSSQIVIPAAMQLIQLDNREIQSPELPTGHYQLNLEPGNHQLVFQYLENWNDNDDAGMIVESEPVILRFDFVADNRYQLQIPTIRDYDEAITFSENIDIALQQNGKLLARGIKASELTANSTNPHVVYRQSGNDEDKGLIPFESNRLKTMKKLWTEATTEERKAFWMWLGPQ